MLKLFSISIKKSIKLKVVLLIILTTLLFASITAVIQALKSHKELHAQKIERLKFIETSYASSIAKIAFDLDHSKLELIANGILNNDDITYIKISEFTPNIENTEELLLEEGVPGNITHNFEYKYSHFLENNPQIVKIKVHSHLPVLRSYISPIFIQHLVNALGISLILSLVTYFILHYTIITRLLNIVEYFNAFKVSTPKNPLNLGNNNFLISSHDEIGELEASINLMRVKLLDYTQQRIVAEQKLKNKNQELLVAKKKAEENDRLKTSFLQNISHEIRTPMNGIMGFTNLLKTSAQSPEDKEMYLDIIEKSGERMLNTLKDIIEMSKIQTGEVTANNETVDICATMQDLFQFYIPIAKNKKLSLILESVPSENTIIETDIAKLNGILNNLIQNAIKYTKKGSIHIGCKASNKKLSFYVKDTGIGIPQKLQTSIFERFRKVQSELSEEFEGSGLGLSISKAYADMLGGNIWVETNLPAGSIFWLSIPYEKVECLKQVNDTHIDSLDLSEYTILIAEDDLFNSVLLEEILKPTKANLLLAKNGQKAVEIATNLPEKTCVLMDIKMPLIDGYEATRMIKEKNPNIPIIAQTGYSKNEKELKTALLLFDDYIVKPIQAVELLAKLKMHLKIP